MDIFLLISIAIIGVVWFVLLLIAFSGQLIAGIFSYLIRQNKKGKKATAEAEAVILGMEATGILINDKSQVKLQVQVKPDKARNFVTEINQLFSSEELMNIKTGMIVKVCYNPGNYRQLLLGPFTKPELPLAV